MGRVILALALACGSPPPPAAAPETLVPHGATAGAPLAPPAWPLLPDPFSDADGAWSDAAGRICAGDAARRDAWRAQLGAEARAPDRGASLPISWGLTGENTCDTRDFCAWMRGLYQAPDADAAIRAALITASAACDEPEDRALRLARLDSHLAAGDVEGTINLLAFLSDGGLPPWLGVALAERWPTQPEALRDAIAIGVAATPSGPDDARAALRCAEQPEQPTCARRDALLRAGAMPPDPATDTLGWVQRWDTDPVGLVRDRPDLRSTVIGALSACAADVGWSAPRCFVALADLDAPGAEALAPLLPRTGDVAALVDDLGDGHAAEAALDLRPAPLLVLAARRAGRTLEPDVGCAPLWRGALALDPGLAAAPKRFTVTDDEGSGVGEVWVDGWWWRAPVAGDSACPFAEVVAAANDLYRRRGVDARWGLVGEIAIAGTVDQWKRAAQAPMPPSTWPTPNRH